MNLSIQRKLLIAFIVCAIICSEAYGAVGRTPAGLRVAVAAMVSPRDTYVLYKEMISNLGCNLNRTIKFIQRKSYADVNILLNEGGIDLAFICSGAYVLNKEKTQLEIIAVPVFDGEPHYYAYIIVNEKSTIKKFSQLKGSRFAFSDPLSNTGRIFPCYLAALRGFKAERYFSKIIFTHSHDNSIKAVANNLIDAASVDSRIWKYMTVVSPEITSRCRIIMISPPFGSPPVVVAGNLDPVLKKRIKTFFLNFHKEKKNAGILNKLMVEKFIEPPPRLYDNIFKMVDKINAAR